MLFYYERTFSEWEVDEMEARGAGNKKLRHRKKRGNLEDRGRAVYLRQTGDMAGMDGIWADLGKNMGCAEGGITRETVMRRSHRNGDISIAR